MEISPENLVLERFGRVEADFEDRGVDGTEGGPGVKGDAGGGWRQRRCAETKNTRRNAMMSTDFLRCKRAVGVLNGSVRVDVNVTLMRS